METSLRFDSQAKHLKLFAKEKFSNDDNYVLTVRVPLPHPLERAPFNPSSRSSSLFFPTRQSSRPRKRGMVRRKKSKSLDGLIT